MQTVGGYYDPWAQPSAEAWQTQTPYQYVPGDAGGYHQGQPAANPVQKKAGSYSGPTGSGSGKSRVGAGGEVDTFTIWDPSTFKHVSQSDAWVPAGMTAQQLQQQQQLQQKYLDPSVPHVRYRTASVAPVLSPRSAQLTAPAMSPTALPAMPPQLPIAGPVTTPVAVPPLVLPPTSPGASPTKPFDPTDQPQLVRRSSRSGSIGSASGRADIESELQQQSLYKTELCRSWNENGTCRYGTKCQFAHGGDEVRPVQRHPKYKTEVCRSWAATGTCPYGTRCRFIHNKSDRAADWALLQAAAQYSPTSASSPLALAAAMPSTTEMELFSGAFDTAMSLQEPEIQNQLEVLPTLTSRRPSIVPVNTVAPTATPVVAPVIAPVATASVAPSSAPAPIDSAVLASLPPAPVVIPNSPAVLPPPSTPLPPPIAPQPTSQTAPTVPPTATPTAATNSAAVPSGKKDKRLPIFQRLTAVLSAKSKSKEKDSEEKDKRKK
jgi:butyrate response factor